MTSAEWLSSRKLREYHIDLVVPDVREASKQLFLAVASGEVRARCQGFVIDPQRFRPLAFHDSNPFALPPDVELSLEDARQRWGMNQSSSG
jgi:hypothetical protein